VPYLSASAVVIHYEEALYQVYGPLPLLNRHRLLSRCCDMVDLRYVFTLFRQENDLSA